MGLYQQPLERWPTRPPDLGHHNLLHRAAARTKGSSLQSGSRGARPAGKITEVWRCGCSCLIVTEQQNPPKNRHQQRSIPQIAVQGAPDFRVAQTSVTPCWARPPSCPALPGSPSQSDPSWTAFQPQQSSPAVTKAMSHTRGRDNSLSIREEFRRPLAHLREKGSAPQTEQSLALGMVGPSLSELSLPGQGPGEAGGLGVCLKLGGISLS